MRPISSGLLAAATLALFATACGQPLPPAWEAANPVQPLPEPPLGISAALTGLETPPTPERVRLGRWLFYDATSPAS